MSTFDNIKKAAEEKFEDAKEGLSGLVDKAKDVVKDDHIDTAAEKLKSVAPDSIDEKIDSVAQKAKELNND